MHSSMGLTIKPTSTTYTDPIGSVLILSYKFRPSSKPLVEIKSTRQHWNLDDFFVGIGLGLLGRFSPTAATRVRGRAFLGSGCRCGWFLDLDDVFFAAAGRNFGLASISTSRSLFSCRGLLGVVGGNDRRIRGFLGRKGHLLVDGRTRASRGGSRGFGSLGLGGCRRGRLDKSSVLSVLLSSGRGCSHGRWRLHLWWSRVGSLGGRLGVTAASQNVPQGGLRQLFVAKDIVVVGDPPARLVGLSAVHLTREAAPHDHTAFGDLYDVSNFEADLLGPTAGSSE